MRRKPRLALGRFLLTATVVKTPLLGLGAALLLVSTPAYGALAQSPPTPDLIQFATDSIEVSELAVPGTYTPNGSAWVFIRFEVARGASAEGGSFRLEIRGGTAERDVDYKPWNDGLVQGPRYGENSWWFLEVFDDGVHEPDETIELTLTNPAGNLVFGPRTKTKVLIRNSPATFSFKPLDGLREQFANRTYPFVVQRHGDRDSDQRVRMRALGGWVLSKLAIFPSASPGEDFRPLDQWLEFTRGETNQIVNLEVLDDGRAEGPESLTLQLSEPSEGVLLPGALAWETEIHDNEVPTHLDVSRPLVPRGLDLGGLSLDEPNQSPWSTIAELRSGSRLVLQEGTIVKVLKSGERDPQFKLQAPSVPFFSWGRFESPNQVLLTEALDGTLWCARFLEPDESFPGGALVHFTASGSIISEQSWNCAMFPEACSEKYPPARLVGIMKDGRLLFALGQYYRMFRLNGAMAPDPAFPTLQLEADFHSPLRFDSAKEELTFGGSVSINGLPLGFSMYQPMRLTELPETALQLLSSYHRYWQGAIPPSTFPATVDTVAESDGYFAAATNINVVFRRLGSSSSSATVQFTTRDLTAKAGEDYVERSGALKFEPLEVEKMIEITLLPNKGRRFIEQFEVVVTRAEGIAELPVPSRLAIYGSSLSVFPELNRIRRIPDGRVLLGGRGDLSKIDSLEYSSDLKTWRPLRDLSQNPWDGSSLWLDESATGFNTRFYRITVP